MRRCLQQLRLVTLVMAGLMVVATPAAAQSVADAAAGVSNGVFVGTGTGQDSAALQAVVADFADDERVVIAVLAGGLPGPLTDRAAELRGATGAETAILFTPDDVAVDSVVHSSGEVDDAFDSAGTRALSSDAGVASRALLEELTANPASASLPLLVIVGVVIALVGGLAAFRIFRTRREEQKSAARALADARAQMRSRLQTIAGQILDVEAGVTLADDEALTTDLTRASRVYRDAQWAFERANSVRAIEALEDAVSTAERLMGQIQSRVG